MSLLLLIDGYNVVAPVAPPGRSFDANWLHRERMLLIERLSTRLAPRVRRRTCVVFDAANPPPDRPSEFEINELTIRFAIDYPEADDLLEELIRDHSAPKQLAVVSSDHRVQAAARRRGATVFESQSWLDALLEGKPQLAVTPSRAGQGSDTPHDKRTAKLDRAEINAWLREFGMDE
jgi:predicted RNA-binding protein with PIN domain